MVVALAVVLAVVLAVTVAGLLLRGLARTGTETPQAGVRAAVAASAMPPAPAAALDPVGAGLPAELARLDLGIAYAAAPGGRVTLAGRLRTGTAWSTIKVPLAVAALQRGSDATTRRRVDAAITRSDNAAAEAMWTRLGGGTRAAAAVDAVLARYGDPVTRTQPRRVRAGFSAFGQTAWALAAQVRFLDRFAAAAPGHPVLAAMGRVVPAQRFGLGRIPGARFKGGWGPGTDGRYVVRQFGLVTLHGRRYVVALAVRPADGRFASGTKSLDQAVTWLRARLR